MRYLSKNTDHKMRIFVDFMAEKAHIMRMKLMVDENEMSIFVNRVGGLKAATQLIKENLKCSKSKAEKLAAGRYPSRLSLLEQAVLAGLMVRPVKKAFRSAS